MNPADRVVFDCNVLFQALIAPQGPAGAVVQAAKNRRVALFLADFVLDELRDVAMRPHLASRFAITEIRLDDYIALLRQFSTLIEDVPHVFDFPRDPDDAYYVDLAVAAHAKLIVSRDRDLLSLADASTADGRDFALRFPGLEIITPPELLNRLA